MSDGDSATPSTQSDDQEPAAQSQLDTLVDLGQRIFVLLHDEQNRAYGRMSIDSSGRVFRIPSSECRRRLQVASRENLGRYPNGRLVGEAMEVLAAVALHEAGEQPVFLRVGPHESNIVLNLADPSGWVVDVSAGGWRLAPTSSVNFLERSVMQPLPKPVEFNDIGLLRKFLNLQTDSDFKLVVSWLLMALSPVGPYPVLILHGEQGSAKSTTTRVLKALIDPVAAPVRAAPQTLRDLAVMAESNWVVALDNLSGLPTWLSDGLCRLSSGGGFGTRALYTDDTEKVFSQQRPVILNGIDAVATRQDLLDRAIVIRLPRLHGYRDEREFSASFELARQGILGALLAGVASAFSRITETETNGRHRMADFVRWTSAAVPAYGWSPTDVIDAYAFNQADALRNSLEGSPVAKAIKQLVDSWQNADELDRSFDGTPTSLLDTLSALAYDQQKQRSWPVNAQVLSRQLTLLAPALRKAGIEIEFTTAGRDIAKERWITITEIDPGTQGARGTQSADQQ